MAELEVRLDRAIDALNAGAEAPFGARSKLGELVELASALRALPADEWPTEDVPDGVVDRLARRLAPPVPTPHARRRPRIRLRAGLALAAAVSLAAVLVVVVLVETQPVSAAVLARNAIAASSGQSLAPMQFTQTTTNYPDAGTFQPAPPPSRVVEHVTIGARDLWRVDTTATEPNGEGTTSTHTVRNGDTIVSVRTSPSSGTTETRRHAGPGAALPTGSMVGARIDPLALLADSHGECARGMSAPGSGPLVAGRETLVLQVDPATCPSASVPEANGAATFLIDKQTYLVLRAVLHTQSGRVSQRLETDGLSIGSTASDETFRLPAPLPAAPPAAALPTNPSRAALRARATFTPLLPTAVPAAFTAGPATSVATQAATGKMLAFTITYAGADGRAAFQLYEAASSAGSVRFPGRRVEIRPGLEGIYSDANGLQILWWTDRGAYVSIQQGGMAAGVPLHGTLSLAGLLKIAASVS